jgi:AcrR family transcriptional regulator
MAQAKGDRTRAQIIEGAIRALAETGVLGATTRKIATESGVQLATLHYHFDNKSAILLAVLESLINEMTLSLRGQVKSGADLDECIDQVLRAGWRVLMQTRALQVVQYELTLYALREGANWLAERQYDAYVQLYLDFLRSIPERESRLSLDDCRAVARFMLAGIDGLLLQELAKSNRARSKRGIEALIGAAQNYARVLREAQGDDDVAKRWATQSA